MVPEWFGLRVFVILYLQLSYFLEFKNQKIVTQNHSHYSLMKFDRANREILEIQT